MKLDTDKQTPEFIELKPDRDLLDINFTGYRLSLTNIPVQTIPIKTRIDKVGPSDGQYALQHVTLFATHNLLFSNPWSPNTVYFVDECWNVYKVDVNPLNGRVQEPMQVWSIPVSTEKRKVGRFNVSMTFPSPVHAIVADGCGSYYLLNWDENSGLYKETFKSVSDQFTPFVIIDATMYNMPEGEAIDVLLMRIEEKSVVKKMIEGYEDSKPHPLDSLFSGDHAFLNVLEWQTVVKDPHSSWSLQNKRLLSGPSGVSYACIEPSGTAIYIDSDAPYYFIYDSEKPIRFAEVEEAPKPVEMAEGEEPTSKPEYIWSQTANEVTLWFNMSTTAKKDDLGVHITTEAISVTYKNTPMLEGKLCHIVKADETVWTIESGKLEIILTKAEENLMWSELVPDNKFGEQILDPELVQEIHSRLGHLCSDKWHNHENPVLTETFSEQLEECDRYPEDAAFMRIDRKSHAVTHQISLSNYPVLFTTRREASSVPAFCSRYLEDGLIWQPEPTLDEEGSGLKNWNVKHFATFSALGYVQAGKEQRKFTVSPSDFSYAAICDAMKHIHIYRQPESLENQLRNRKSGRQVSHVSSQQLIAVDPPVEILGAHASPEYLFVLTANHLHAYRMKEDVDT